MNKKLSEAFMSINLYLITSGASKRLLKEWKIICEESIKVQNFSHNSDYKAAQEDKWMQGFACACAVTLKNHGCDTEVRETYSCNFQTVAQLKAAGVDKYDIDILRPIIKGIENSHAMHNMRTHPSIDIRGKCHR